MSTINNSSPSLLGPLVGWAIVHSFAAAGMWATTSGTPLVAGDMTYRWFFVTIYIFAGLIPLAAFAKERRYMVPITPAHAMSIAFGLQPIPRPEASRPNSTILSSWANPSGVVSCVDAERKPL